MKNLYCIILLLVSGNSSALAQQWVDFDSNNTNMPNDLAWPIARDNNGDMWIGFEDYNSNGVVKFDGNWNIYASSSSNSVVGVLEVDQNNHLWTAMPCGGKVSKFDGSIWIDYDNSNSPLSPADAIQAIYIDGNNNVWIGSSESGLLKFDGNTWSVYNPTNSALPSFYVSSITQDSNGDMWIGTWPYWNGNTLVGGGLAKFTGTTFSVFDISNSPIPSNGVNRVRCDAGNVWLTTGNGEGITCLSNNMVWSFFSTVNGTLPNDTILTMEVNGNNVWASCPQGLFKVGTNVVYPLGNTNKQISEIEFDIHNNIWISYGYFGLFQCFEGMGITVFNDSLIAGPLSTTEYFTVNPLHIFPNPMNHTATVEIPVNSESADFILYDLSGREVKQMKNITESRFELQRDGLSGGMYFYKLFNSDTKKPFAVGKIMIQ